VDRIKRISFEVLEAHKSKFGEDFVENKKALNEIAIVRSKGLKNKVAGYITRFLKKQIREDKIKHDRSGMNYSNVEEQESTLDIEESGEIDESGEEITLTNEEVETITSTTPSVDEKTE
jgi:small subunit ribosomal protein S17e